MMPEERSPSPGSSVSNRKSAKPIMEKRRRARINASLSELKALLLEVMKREGSRHSKMEKADILEMTVRHLRHIQRQQFAAVASSDPTCLNKYNAGFNECTSEVSRYLHSIEGVDPDIRARVLDHLATCVANTAGVGSDGERSFSIQNVASIRPMPAHPEVSSRNSEGKTAPVVANLDAPASFSNPQVNLSGHVMSDFTNGKCMLPQSNAGLVASRPTSAQTQTATVAPLSTQQSSPGNVAIGGLQVIPTRLPSGELAFVLPQNVLNTATQPPSQSYILPVFTGNGAIGPSNQPTASAIQTTTPVSAVSIATPSSAQTHQPVAMATVQNAQQTGPIRIETSNMQSAFLTAPSFLSANGLSGSTNLSPIFHPAAAGPVQVTPSSQNDVGGAHAQYQSTLPSIIMLPSNHTSAAGLSLQPQPYQGISPNLPGLVKPGDHFQMPSLKDDDVWRPW